MSDTEQILREIDAAKARFEANVSALAGGLPPTDELVGTAKRYGAIGGGGAVAVAVLGAVAKARSSRREKQRQLDMAARALAKSFKGVVPVEVNVPRAGTSPLGVVAVVAAVGALAVGALNLRKLQSLS